MVRTVVIYACLFLLKKSYPLKIEYSLVLAYDKIEMFMVAFRR